MKSLNDEPRLTRSCPLNRRAGRLLRRLRGGQALTLSEYADAERLLADTCPPLGKDATLRLRRLRLMAFLEREMAGASSRFLPQGCAVMS